MVFDRLLSSIDGGDLLDLGCGMGQFTGILVKSLKSFRSVTGVDVDAEILEEAGKAYPDPAFRFLQVSGGILPFDAESFDMVAISKALHHVRDPELTLREMKRVLRKGGYFLINEMHCDRLSEAQESHMLYHHIRSDLDKLLGIPHQHTFKHSELIRLTGDLELEDRVIAEFNPDAGDPMDAARIGEFNHKLDGWLKELEGLRENAGLPERREIEARIQNLRERLQKVGFSRAPQLVILGKK
jgi:SAM-dependent methyltransferase